MQSTPHIIAGVIHELLMLSENGIRVLVVPNDDPLVSGFSSFLTKQQRARCRRFHEPADRHAAMVCKGLWRVGAGMLLGCDPQSVPMEHDQWGRPVLIGHDRQSMDLNVSRTRSHSALVVARGVRVGIDIESVVPELVTDSLIRAVTLENEWLSVFLENHEFFFQYWTQKEAVLKGDGRGLSIDPREIELPQDFSVNSGWSSCGCLGVPWYTAEIECLKGTVGAVGVDREAKSFEQVSWETIVNHAKVRRSCARPHVMNP